MGLMWGDIVWVLYEAGPAIEGVSKRFGFAWGGVVSAFVFNEVGGDDGLFYYSGYVLCVSRWNSPV